MVGVIGNRIPQFLLVFTSASSNHPLTILASSLAIHFLLHQAAGFQPLQARGLGVSVDHRRHNRSQESFNLNVQRLKEYKAKLIVFPRKSNKSVKAGDSSVEEQKQAQQVLGKQVLPVVVPERKIKARVITAAERDANVAVTLRKSLTDAKRWGARAKRAVEKVRVDRRG